MRNLCAWEVIVSTIVLSLVGSCGGPSSIDVDESSELRDGRSSSVSACCRRAHPPGWRRGHCIAEAMRGRGICAHAQKHDAGACDAGRGGSGGAGGLGGGGGTGGEAGGPGGEGGGAGNVDAGDGSGGSSDAAGAGGTDAADGSTDLPPGGECGAASPNDVWQATSVPQVPAQMFATGVNDVWMIDGAVSSSVWRWDGAAWTSMLAAPSGERLSSIWASAPDDVWVAGKRLRRWNGAAWSDITPPELVSSSVVTGLWGRAANDVWLATDVEPQRLLHWDGSSWTARPTPPSPTGQAVHVSALWGSAPDDVWAVGYYFRSDFARLGAMMRWNGVSWAATAGGPYTTIWGSAANDVWAGGGGGLSHFDGVAWNGVGGVPASGAIWGSCRNNVWAIAQKGDGGTSRVSHFDGVRWSTWVVDVDPAREMLTITGFGPDHVWVGGYGSPGPTPFAYRRVPGDAPPVCGNGLLDPGEQCDPPDARTCAVTCQKAWLRGDGVLDPGEQCDPPHAAPPFPACDGYGRLIASPACVADGDACDATLPCCGGESCANGYCGGQTCRAAGSGCNGGAPCCGGLRCSSGTCACVPKGAACAGSETCCEGSCTSDGFCGTCAARGSSCDTSTPCCFGSVCSAGVCVKSPQPACMAVGGVCSNVAAGDTHSCAVAFDGSAKCWGSNNQGKLGNNSLNDSLVAVQVEGLTSGVTAIAAGYSHTCAIVNGAAKCWGANDRGQLGNPLVADRSLVPVQVEGLTAGVTAIAAASLHTCAVVNGAAKCWGANSDGQLGNDALGDSPVPVQVLGLTAGVTGIAAGSSYPIQINRSCAVVNSRAQCWGRYLYGSLNDWSPVPVEVAGLSSGVTAIAVGSYHTCAIADGGVRCWGATSIGVPEGEAASHVTIPVPIAGLTAGVTAIAAGKYITCASVNGEARCLGMNTYGEAGNGTTNWATTPVPVQGLTSGVTALAIGTAGGSNHVCAMVHDKVECWGSNGYGELGNGSRTNSSVPVMVTDIPPPPPCECTVGKEVCDIASGGPVFCVAGSDGCGHWGPRPPPFGGCTGRLPPAGGITCSGSGGPYYCYWDAAGCRTEASCPTGQVCVTPPFSSSSSCVPYP